VTGPWPHALGLALAFAAFGLWPSIDLRVAGLFFDGTGFPIAGNLPVETLRRVLNTAEDLLGLAAFALAALAGWRGPVLGQGARPWLYQGLVFLLGPALLVNGVLKPLWARPRPFASLPFGGPYPFQSIWQWQGLCPRNCSFSSGEAAGATALLVMGVMLARANRDRLGAWGYRTALTMAILPLPFTLWQRMAAGKHFLSDVTVSALAVALLASLLARALRPLA
jgi:lipid A 4'-phosphatase